MIGEYIQFAGLKFEVNKTAGRIVRSRLKSQRNYLFLDYYNQSNRSVHDNMSNPFSGAKASGKAQGQKKKKKASRKARKNMEATLSSTRPGGMITKNVNRSPLNNSGQATGFAAGHFEDEKYPMNGQVQQYMRALKDPFNAVAPSCPVGYNPVPTYASFPARSTNTTELTVGAGVIVQLTLFAGHSIEYDADEMDGPSYHSTSVNIRRGNDSAIVTGTPGPVNSGARVAILGATSYVATPGIVPAQNGSALTDLSFQSGTINFAGSQAGPLTVDNPLPFDASEQDGDHTRWKVVCMGIRAQNITPVSNRGGQFISVQPDTEFASNRINDYSRFKTFKVYEGSQMRTSLIPKPYDQSYWHTAGSAASSTTTRAASIMVWFHNSTASAQTISFQIVANWQLAGNSVKPMCQPSLSVPKAEDIINPTIAVLQNSTHTAEEATKVADIVHATQHPMWQGLRGKIESKLEELGPRIIQHLGNRAMDAAVPQLLSLV